MSNTQQLLDFIRQGRYVSYDLVMEFVDDCLTIRQNTAVDYLRHSKKKVKSIQKEPNKHSSPIIAYEWIGISNPQNNPNPDAPESPVSQETRKVEEYPVPIKEIITQRMFE